MSTAAPRRVVFLGPPGSGKGSYSKRVAPRLGVPHLSTGDMLRQEVDRGTALGRRIESQLREGRMVSDDVVLGAVRSALEGGGPCQVGSQVGSPDAPAAAVPAHPADASGPAAGAGVGYVLDGFPRTVSQARALDTLGGGDAHCVAASAVDRVIHIHMDESILVDKLLGRRVCAECGISFNIADVDTTVAIGETGCASATGDNGGRRHARVVMPPVLPERAECLERRCVDRLAQRSDDTAEVIAERLVQYHRETAPVVDFYRKQGLVRDIVITGGYDVMTPVFERALDIHEA